MALIKVKTGGVDSTTNLGRRNLIINGAMQVAQRGSTFTAPDGVYTLDRFQFYQGNGAVFDVNTSTDAPAEFSNSLEIDCTTAAASPASGAYGQMVYRIEGQDVQRLAYGTSSAKKITLSFYVKSNKTGTYQVNFRKSTATTQMASKTYTINSADTWERKSVTIDGATGFSLTGGNSEGLMVDWWYHSGTDYSSGSVSETYINLVAANYNAGATANLGDNTSNYLRMTGVQLEVGDTDTPFEHRSFGEELSLCQRYFQKISGGSDAFVVAAKGQGSATVDASIPLTVPLRASPTMNSINSRTFNDAGFYASSSTTPTVSQYSDNNIILAVNCGGFTGLVNNEIQNWGPVSNVLTIDAEL
jgi:hypothetical protein